MKISVRKKEKKSELSMISFNKSNWEEALEDCLIGKESISKTQKQFFEANVERDKTQEKKIQRHENECYS